jgi:transposase InsO family protein/transposase-like protein
MYSYKERVRAVELYLKNDKSTAQTIRELGYPSRNMLYNWYKEYEARGTLRSGEERGHSKYTSEQRKQAIQYYQEHGRSLSRTIKALGFPKRTTLRDWIREDLSDDEKHCFTGKTLVRYTEEQKEQAVIRFCAGDGTAKEIATELGATEGSLNRWKRRLLRERCRDKVPEGKKPKKPEAAGDSNDSIEGLRAEKQSLTLQVEELKGEVFRLQLERDILEKAGEILKKGKGINPETLTNREKAVLIDALRDKYRLELLLNMLGLAKSSYCYQEHALHSPDKYAILRVRVKEIFAESNNCYGYRRIHAVLQREGVCVSEKVIRRIMREERLTIAFVKKKKYNSYLGEITPEVANLINRDFSADVPNEKWLTDITEFSISAGKVYLSPIVDCFDGMAVAWTIGTSPDAELVNSMLDAAVPLLREGEHPVIHSDRGCHYRWPGWIDRVTRAELTRSMSRKGCSPDNSACEGFFGRVKNEMFYGRSWVGVSVDEFVNTLDAYLRWYNETRIKMSLGAMSPVEYRKSLGLTQRIHCT